MPFSSALRSTDLIRAYVYWINGPVFPLKSMDSLGLNVIFLRGSTFSKKYFNAPSPTVSLIFSASSSDTPSKKLSFTL